jgi:hypothetical protein
MLAGGPLDLAEVQSLRRFMPIAPDFWQRNEGKALYTQGRGVFIFFLLVLFFGKY